MFQFGQFQHVNTERSETILNLPQWLESEQELFIVFFFYNLFMLR